MNSAFGTHTLLQQRTLNGISDSLDWLGVFHHTVSATIHTRRGERDKYGRLDCWWPCDRIVKPWDRPSGYVEMDGTTERGVMYQLDRKKCNTELHWHLAVVVKRMM
jgi:hypothetical protein